MEPTRMMAEVRLREVLGVFIGLELVFGLVRVRELLLEDGVFMGGVLLGCGWMMLVGWDGNFLSAGPVRDAAHERSGVRGSFHGGGGEVLSSRGQWGGGGDGDHKHIFTKTFPLRFFLVTKLLLGHAAVFEALLRQRGSRTSAPLRCGHGEAELPRHVRSQAGAWERGDGQGAATFLSLSPPQRA
jgi:hypothetical protein